MDNFKTFLLEFSKEELFSLGQLQREKPERAMLKFQFLMGGGIMNPAVENIGDLTHRMCDKNTFTSAGYEHVREKVAKALRWLTQGYGFNREFEGNITNNAREMKVDENEFRQKIYKSLENYADEHAKLPVYNRAQEVARLAAVSLGRRKFNTTIGCLKILMNHLNSPKEWVEFAHQGLT